MDRRIWLLTAAQFASATGAYAFTGLLANLAADLGVSLATAGQLAAAYALTYAIAGAPVAALTARLDRRAMLVWGLGLVAALNIATAFATDFSTALMLRVAAGLAVTLVMPGVAASMLVPPEQRGRAIAIVLSGLTLAFSLGIPLGTAIGGVAGWRGCFIFSGALAGLAALGVQFGLPRLPSTDRGGAASLGIILRPAIATLLGTTLLAFAGLFCIAAYLGPIVTAATGIEGSGIGAIQVFIGLGSLAGIAIGSRVAGSQGARIPVMLFVLLAVALVGYTLLLLTPQAFWHAAPLALCVFAGSVALFALAPLVQTRLMHLAPQDRAVAIALNGATTFAGQGAGAAYGGIVIGAAGLAWTGLAGAMLAAAGALLGLRAFRK
ncbi:MFS transporter [Falsiroseomonas stagni]|uniref:Predicted arabinose efflux permease, MFS family n=1 Tax=Falsiroseomonas stagni DSM 19981 TaxID=1123062 RepID=A0A1I4D4E6_9PROT|nr:MFS transporter [Falsiroseomonas stagni]SFK87863.1 Predicted arabinose efflux permease, MFS family [Falsiroseomonas stagni DSM 19981]